MHTSRCPTAVLGAGPAVADAKGVGARASANPGEREALPAAGTPPEGLHRQHSARTRPAPSEAQCCHIAENGTKKVTSFSLAGSSHISKLTSVWVSGGAIPEGPAASPCAAPVGRRRGAASPGSPPWSEDWAAQLRSAHSAVVDRYRVSLTGGEWSAQAQHPQLRTGRTWQL